MTYTYICKLEIGGIVRGFMGVEKINLSNILMVDVIYSKFKADLKKLALDFEFISLMLVSQKNKSLPLIISHDKTFPDFSNSLFS